MERTSALQPFAADVWLVDGPPVVNYFVPLPTRAIIVKLRDGSLWINSPVAVDPQTLAQIVALGPVRYLVAPTPLHVWRLELWRASFPEAELWGPQRLGDGRATPWMSEIEHVAFRGNAILDEFEFFHKASRTLMMTDFIQSYPAKDRDVWGNLVKAFGGVLNGGMPRDIRWTITNRKRARASVEHILAWDFDGLILAHGSCISHDARAFVENAFAWLGLRA
jgi:hypothetical protein